MTTRFRSISVAVLASLFLSALSSSANLLQVLPEMGDLTRWAVFTLGDDVFRDHLTDNAIVQGDVGAAGNGDCVMEDDAVIDGDLYYRSNGEVEISDNATITGAQFNNQDALLDDGVEEALDASRAAWTLVPTRPDPKIKLAADQSQTISGAPGETVVLKLNNFMLSGNATLTLQGTASTTFIINVKNQFSLSENAQIVLAGGVLWENVLFNVRGKGSDVSISGNASFSGILLANKRTVQVRDQATVNGEVIANRVVLKEDATINHPPLSSP